MTFQLFLLTFFQVFGRAAIAVEADAPGVQMKLQARIENLDEIADQTHGFLKWSNGAFLYMDAVNGLPPAFHTLDREGRLSSSAALNIPEAFQFRSISFDRRMDGSVVFAGEATFADGKASPLIASISPDGRTQWVTRTDPYYAYMISVAPDGTIWTIGCEMVNYKANAPGLNPNAGVLRHFDANGKLIGSFSPQSRYVAAGQELRLTSGYLSAKRDRIGWYSPRWVKNGHYVEISLDSMTESAYPGLPAPPQGGMIDGFGLADNQTAFLSLYSNHKSPRLTYTFDRGTLTWSPSPMTGFGSPGPRLLGSDGDQLVLLRGRGAAFFDVSH